MKHLILTILFALSLFAQEIGVPYILSGNEKDGETSLIVSTKSTETIFTVSRNSVIHSLNLKPIKVNFVFDTGHEKINALSLSSNGEFIITCGSDKLLKAWDAQSGKLLQTFIGHNSPVKSAVILSDNKTLISSDENMTIKYWDIASGKELKSFIVYSHIDPDTPKVLHNLYLSKDEKILIAYHSHDIVFMDTQSGEKRISFTHKGYFHENASYFDKDVLYVLKGSAVLEYNIGKYSEANEHYHQDIVVADPQKRFKFGQESTIVNSCITDENDILGILIHSFYSGNNDRHLTSPPLLKNNIKFYGKDNSKILIDRCPLDDKSIEITLMGNGWTATTADGYFDSNNEARKFLYMKNKFGKIVPMNEATYSKYHTTIKMEK